MSPASLRSFELKLKRAGEAKYPSTRASGCLFVVFFAAKNTHPDIGRSHRIPALLNPYAQHLKRRIASCLFRSVVILHDKLAFSKNMPESTYKKSCSLRFRRGLIDLGRLCVPDYL